MFFISNEEEIKYNKGYCVIYFFAHWMPYHKKMIIMIEKMNEKYPNNKYFAINTDNFKNQCKRFNIKSIPTVLIFRNGLEIKRITGCVLTSAFTKAFADIFKTQEKYNVTK